MLVSMLKATGSTLNTKTFDQKINNGNYTYKSSVAEGPGQMEYPAMHHIAADCAAVLKIDGPGDVHPGRSVHLLPRARSSRRRRRSSTTHRSRRSHTRPPATALDVRFFPEGDAVHAPDFWEGQPAVEKFLSLTVSGAITGAIFSLVAAGLVLSYTATGIFNFSYGAVAFTSAFLFYQLNSGLHGRSCPRPRS